MRARARDALQIPLLARRQHLFNFEQGHQTRIGADGDYLLIVIKPRRACVRNTARSNLSQTVGNGREWSVVVKPVGRVIS